MWFLQIAQLSTTISHAQRATADHFFTSKRFLSSPPLDFPFEVFLTWALGLAAGASVMSTSAIVVYVEELL